MPLLGFFAWILAICALFFTGRDWRLVAGLLAVVAVALSIAVVLLFPFSLPLLVLGLASAVGGALDGLHAAPTISIWWGLLALAVLLWGVGSWLYWKSLKGDEDEPPPQP